MQNIDLILPLFNLQTVFIIIGIAVTICYKWIPNKNSKDIIIYKY
jgi:hypothetical protein